MTATSTSITQARNEARNEARNRVRPRARTLALACAAALAGTGAHAACEIEGEGSVRILGNDFAALTILAREAKACAGEGVEVEANLTTEHKNLQVPALSIKPAEYTVALVANNSIVPLMTDDLVRPLDDLVERYGQSLRPNQLIKSDGKTVAVAFMVNSQHLFVREDVLEEAGVETPTSYEEVLAAAKAIREAGIMDNPLGATDAAGWYLAAEFVNTYLGLGGEFFAPGSAEPAIEGEAGLSTLENMRAMTEYMSTEYLTYTADELQKRWLAGELAIMNQWGSMVNGHIDPDGPAPEIAAATVLAAAPTIGGGEVPASALWWDGFTIATNVSDEDAAASFQAMVHAIRPEIAAEHPTVATWLMEGYEPPAGAAGVMATAEGGARAYPMSPYMGLMHTALGAELPDFLQGKESAEQALADVAAAYTASAKEAGFLN